MIFIYTQKSIRHQTFNLVISIYHNCIFNATGNYYNITTMLKTAHMKAQTNSTISQCCIKRIKSGCKYSNSDVFLFSFCICVLYFVSIENIFSLFTKIYSNFQNNRMHRHHHYEFELEKIIQLQLRYFDIK